MALAIRAGSKIQRVLIEHSTHAARRHDAPDSIDDQRIVIGAPQRAQELAVAREAVDVAVAEIIDDDRIAEFPKIRTRHGTAPSRWEGKRATAPISGRRWSALNCLSSGGAGN